MSELKLAWTVRRGRSSQVLITLLVAIALATVIVSSAAGQARQLDALPAFNETTAIADGYVYVPIRPNRILDTRSNLGLTGPLQSKVARTFQVTDLHPTDDAINVPANAVAVTGNLAVDKQTAYGYFSLTKTPTNNPTTANLNFPADDIRSNGVTQPLGPGGTLSVTYVYHPARGAG